MHCAQTDTYETILFYKNCVHNQVRNTKRQKEGRNQTHTHSHDHKKTVQTHFIHNAETHVKNIAIKYIGKTVGFYCVAVWYEHWSKPFFLFAVFSFNFRFIRFGFSSRDFCMLFVCLFEFFVRILVSGLFFAIFISWCARFNLLSFLSKSRHIFSVKMTRCNSINEGETCSQVFRTISYLDIRCMCCQSKNMASEI